MVLFNGMEKTSHWAALYFVALMTFGNYVLFNLLVAILVEGFSSEVSMMIAYTMLHHFGMLFSTKEFTTDQPNQNVCVCEQWNLILYILTAKRTS